MPLWAPVILLIASAVVNGLLLSVTEGKCGTPLRGADVVFAVGAFWVWAATTNAHGRLLARSSGKRPGNQRDRSEEFATIIGLGVVTAILYIVCFFPKLESYAFIAAAMAVLLPVLFMERPDTEDQ